METKDHEEEGYPNVPVLPYNPKEPIDLSSFNFPSNVLSFWERVSHFYNNKSSKKDNRKVI